MNKVYGISKEEKKIAIYQANSGETFDFYAENGEGVMTREQFHDIKSKPITSTHLLVRYDKRIRDSSLKDQYEDFIRTADKLKELTDGKINMYKTGSYAKTALKLFYDMGAPVPDQLETYEHDIIRKCKTGGIIYEGKGYKYDVVSQYPGAMRNQVMKYPIKKGNLKTMTKEEFDKLEYFTFGIYHVKITSTIDKRLFTENEENWYTHIDLNHARTELGYDMKLIEVDDNWLDYTGCLMNGCKLFRPFVDYLYKFKKEGHKEVKLILNSLWGALCQKNILTFNINTEEKHELFEVNSVIQISPMGKGSWASQKLLSVNKIATQSKYYDNDFARISPFLTAKCRKDISFMVKFNLKNVVRIYIDGLILKKKIKDVELKDEIGFLKLEQKYDHLKINNARDVKYS